MIISSEGYLRLEMWDFYKSLNILEALPSFKNNFGAE